MRIAISTFDGRVSPLFDVAQYILLVDLENQEEVRQKEIQISESEAFGRRNFLGQLSIDILICGAISRQLEMILVSAGIQVIPNICGQIDQVLNEYLVNQLSNSSFLMPGCCKRRHRGNCTKRQGRNKRRRYN